MRVVFGLLLLICVSILPAGCGKPRPPLQPTVDASTAEKAQQLLPPPGMPGGATAPRSDELGPSFARATLGSLPNAPDWMCGHPVLWYYLHMPPHRVFFFAIGVLSALS